MKTKVYRVFNVQLEKLTDEERFAYEHGYIRGNVSLPRYPIELSDESKKLVSAKLVDAEYMTIGEFVKNPPFFDYLAGKEVKEILDEIDRDQWIEHDSWCLGYTLFEDCIVITEIYDCWYW